MYARSSYYYDNMLIICLFSDILSDFHVNIFFRLWFHACNLLYITSPQKQVTDISLVLKDSDMDSENLSSLIRLSLSDGQKTDSSKVGSVIGI